jgi:hypothetical protein
MTHSLGMEAITVKVSGVCEASAIFGRPRTVLAVPFRPLEIPAISSLTRNLKERGRDPSSRCAVSFTLGNSIYIEALRSLSSPNPSQVRIFHREHIQAVQHVCGYLLSMATIMRT